MTDHLDQPAAPAQTVRRHRTRRGLPLAATAIAVALAAAAWAVAPGSGPRSRPSASTAGLVAVTVQRRDLLSSQSVPGKLGYADARTLAAPVAGVITALPSGGSVVGPGHVLLRIDGRPVVLLSGGVPMYRALRVGASGPDAAQLERNLRALGYDRDRPLTVDDRYTGATARAVRRL